MVAGISLSCSLSSAQDLDIYLTTSSITEGQLMSTGDTRSFGGNYAVIYPTTPEPNDGDMHNGWKLVVILMCMVVVCTGVAGT
jgi:hypothetical protein